jgi:hypothetical protein
VEPQENIDIPSLLIAHGLPTPSSSDSILHPLCLLGHLKPHSILQSLFSRPSLPADVTGAHLFFRLNCPGRIFDTQRVVCSLQPHTPQFTLSSYILFIKPVLKNPDDNSGSRSFPTWEFELLCAVTKPGLGCLCTVSPCASLVLLSCGDTRK